jgi:hypothetical protein
MKWQCALLQRWLPEYPDGDLPAFWKRRLSSHLEYCPACRQELAAMREVVAAIKSAPVAEPEPEFWSAFSRELHLKLARVAQENQEAPAAAPRLWWFRLPYLLGAPALAVLALFMVTYFTNPERPSLAPQPQVAEKAAPGKALEASKMAEAPKAAEAPRVAAAPQPERARTPALAEVPVGATQDRFAFATMNNNGSLPDPDDDNLDFTTGDLDSILAGMTDQEKEIFLKKLHQKKRDGSWFEGSSSVLLA